VHKQAVQAVLEANSEQRLITKALGGATGMTRLRL